MARKDLDRPVTVTGHALKQFQQRNPGFEPPAPWTLSRWIVEEVGRAIVAGRVVAGRKPRGWRLYHEGKRGRLETHQRFVWTDDRRHGFIVAYDPTEFVVITCLVPVGALA